MNEPGNDRERHHQPETAFVAELIAYFRTVRSYPEAHPVAATSAGRVLERLASLTAGGPFVLGVGRHALLVHGEFLERNNPRFGELAALLSAHGVVTLAFENGLTAAELKSFGGVINRPREEIWEEGGMGTALSLAGIFHITAQGIDPSLFMLTEGLASENYENPWDRFLKLLMAGDFPARRETLMRMLMAEPQRLAEVINKLLEQLPPAARQASLQSLAAVVVAGGPDKETTAVDLLETLLTFVLQLSPDLRRDFLLHLLVTSRDDTRLSEALLKRLPHDVVLDALNSAQARGDRLPPLVLKLLHRLAAIGAELPPPAEAPAEVLEQKITTLLKQQHLEDYLPPEYRNILFSILETNTLPEGDRRAIEELSATLGPDQQERHTADLIVRIMKLLPAGERAAGISTNLAELAPVLLESGDFATLARLTEACRNEGAPPPFATFPFALDVLDAAPFVQREQYPLLRAILVGIGDPAVAPLLDRLAVEESRSLRWLYLDCLLNLGPAVRAEVMARIEDPRWHYVRNLLILLRNFRDDEVLKLVRRFVQHPHPRVRTEALRSAFRLHDPAAERLLQQELVSGNPERMLAAVQAADASRSASVTRQVLIIITRKTVADYGLELKRAAIQALAAIGDPQVLPEFAAFLASRNLFHPFKHRRVKIEIVRSLRRYAASQARDLLRELAAAQDRKLALAAAETLRATQGGRP